MFNCSISRHASKRFQQRGLSSQDIELVVKIGSMVAPDAYMITNTVADGIIAEYKRKIQRVERLRNTKVIEKNGWIITSYCANSKEQKRTMRRKRAIL